MMGVGTVYAGSRRGCIWGGCVVRYRYKRMRQTGQIQDGCRLGANSMGESVTIELPSELAQRARAVATQTHQRLEGVLLDWLDRGDGHVTRTIAG